MADITYVVVNWTQRSTQRFPELNEARAALREMLADGDEYTIWAMAEATGPGTPTDRGTFRPSP